MLNETKASPRSASGLADLACALATRDKRLIGAMSDLLGLEKMHVPKKSAKRKERFVETVDRLPLKPIQELPIQLDSGSIDPVQFWRLHGYQVLGERPDQETPVIATDDDPWPEFSRCVQQDLATWRELHPRLRGALSEARESRELDTEELVRRVGQGRMLQRLPRRRYPGWGPRVIIVLDRSERLTPYWQDQDRVLAALVRLLPRHGVELSVFREGSDAPETLEKLGKKRIGQPPPGALILVLGDLGCLSHESGDLQVWQHLGLRWRAAGCRPLALSPCWPLPNAGSLQSCFSVLPWERSRGLATEDAATRRVGVQRLLRLLSPAVRIEPALLRAVRLSLGSDAPDASAEAKFWQSTELSSRSSVAASLDAKAAVYLRDQFSLEPLAARKAALACLRSWRADQPKEIWCEELLTIAAMGQQEQLPDQRDLVRARRFYQRISQQGRGMGTVPPPGALRWYRRCENRLPDTAWRDRQAGTALQRLSWALHKDEPDYAHAHRVSPENTQVDEVLRRFSIVHKGDNIEFSSIEVDSTRAEGSPLAIIESRSGQIKIASLEATPQLAAEFWVDGRQPDWADTWGWDEYGAWLEFVIEPGEAAAVRQRLRWIQPGRFRMGSPDDEPGRYQGEEGPQHDVIISKGYWLFDTPCTQALWVAVMGDNPSYFKSQARPVEQVSWHECQQFFERINQRFPDLDLSLPSEAQWEYACRSGTQEAIYQGKYELLGENNAPALDSIAWYGGNSGIDFELDNGYDASDWPEKQYTFDQAGTHPVRRKTANAWGLYDMLGNVWEWCQDDWRDYTEQEIKDPVGSVKAGAGRVVRGGSWDGSARDVRCACRDRYPPEGRLNGVGFRPARVQVREPGSMVAEPVVPAFGRQAERRPTQVPSGAAESVTLRGSERSGQCFHPDTTGFEVVSDSAFLTFRGLQRPSWAQAMGRDRYGLWVEIQVKGSGSAGIVQRLRWIPPGKFMMGSPSDEPGRRDNEGPQHPVTITKGYWLFDTPCTQALWQAVMSENPSRFQSPNRPVERVSFEDCEKFLARLNESQPELELSLPTEAQWEYACRAGTETALYTGNIEIIGDANAPVLDPIAWYAGNSGVDYELTKGENLDFYTDRQYSEKSAGTHPVAYKKQNAWGLYDTLGNVWEWCRDGEREYTRDSVNDPVGPSVAGAERVVRGGSWGSLARLVRCACRDQDLPEERFNFIGFRPARVQS